VSVIFRINHQRDVRVVVLLKQTIEAFYIKYKGYLETVQAYTMESGLADVMQACRMKPLNHYISPLPVSARLERHWCDESRCSILIKKRKIKTVQNDLSVPANISTTDMFCNLSIFDLPKISQSVYIGVGTDESDRHVFILSFLGDDMFIRSRLYVDGNWQKVSPIVMTIPLVRELLRGDRHNASIVGNESTVPDLPFIWQYQYTVPIPIPDEFKATIMSSFPFLFRYLC